MNIFEREKEFLKKASLFLESYELDITLFIYSDGTYFFKIFRSDNDDEILGSLSEDKETIYSSSKKNDFILTICEPLLK